MTARAKFPPLWFAGVLAYMIVLQIIRLYQTSPLDWLLCDYAQRLGALIPLAVIPAARRIAYQTQKLRVSWWELLLWIAGLIFVSRFAGPPISFFADAVVPHTVIGGYPPAEGALYLFDLIFGVMLVAFHEEILFRRCARAVFGAGWGDGLAMVVLSALLFAVYHWWSGIGNISYTFVFGLYAMQMLRRTGALWPLIAAHYLNDLIAFS